VSGWAVSRDGSPCREVKEVEIEPPPYGHKLQVSAGDRKRRRPYREDVSTVLQRILKLAAWSALVIIIVVTLSPVGLRPVVTSDPVYERFAAFAGMGVLFGLSYIDSKIWVCSIVLGSALGLEALQLITPDRHGHLIDVAEKMFGGLFGLALSRVICRYQPLANFLSR
jgi:hypothetical protein